jgi:NAD(P)-dependent dehydrogenase (short-subunit alcohol dehydrogenase family)
MTAFDGQSVIVTGAGSGIGAAIARLFVERGANVLIVDRDSHLGSTVADEIAASGDVAFFEGDISDSGTCDLAVGRAVERWGRVDILVNNAGGGRLLPTETLSDADWREMQAGNLDTAFFMSRAALIPMLSQGNGAIVNIASVHGHVGLAQHVAYGAAKGGVLNMTRAMAVEFGKRGIRVNAISPGVIRTPAFDRAVGQAQAQTFIDLHPIGRIGMPLEVAKAACFLASSEASFITGANLMVDGGFTAQ